MAEKEKVEVEDIIGLVKTDEPTDSVQLKKEAQLSICEKRLIELEKENEQLKQQLDETIERLHKEITTSENAFEGLMNENKELRDACKNYDWYKLYNQLLNENEQLKLLIKKVLETTPIEHSLALDLKNSIRELYK